MKKFAPKKKWSVTIILFMNCKIAYIVYWLLLSQLYNSFDDIFTISKIHSRQLIILYFLVFCRKKINLQRQQKIFYMINTASSIS